MFYQQYVCLLMAINLHDSQLLLPGQSWKFLNKLINSVSACLERNGAQGLSGWGGVFAHLTGNLAANIWFGKGHF